MADERDLDRWADDGGPPMSEEQRMALELAAREAEAESRRKADEAALAAMNAASERLTLRAISESLTKIALDVFGPLASYRPSDTDADPEGRDVGACAALNIVRDFEWPKIVAGRFFSAPAPPPLPSPTGFPATLDLMVGGRSVEGKLASNVVHWADPYLDLNGEVVVNASVVYRLRVPLLPPAPTPEKP